MVHLLNIYRLNRWLVAWLVVVFIFFTGFHFWRLSEQEFIGDEAAIMLNIDVALDSIDTGNLSYLAYPFLWHHEPLRAVIEGTLLHFFGVNPVLLRLPNILFDLAVFWVLVYIFMREKVSGWLVASSMFAYAMSAFLMIGRMTLTDGWTRLFLLVIGYLCYDSVKSKDLRKLIVAMVVYTVSLMRVLDTAIMIVPIFWSAWKIKAWWNRNFLQIGLVMGVVLALYFGLWAVLPYSAYRMGLIENYKTNGLFYYLNRASDGSARDFGYNFQILSHYSSEFFALWMLGSFLIAIVVKKLRVLLFVSLAPLVAIYLLFQPSIHITSYIGIFFWQAVMVAGYITKKYKIFGPAVIATILMIGLFNLQQLKKNFWDGRIKSESRFVWGHADVPRPGYDLDEAVKRIYLRHGIDPEGRIEIRDERWGK